MTQWNWPVIGHKNVVKFLQRSIENGKISHAYLFYGPENLGKKSVAKYFALSLICQKEKKPCLECENCKGFLKDIHPDVIWLRKKEAEENNEGEGEERGGRKKKVKNISIDQIRDLKQKISLSGFTDSYKVVIIVNAEEMSEEAANSFLKILEEPPARSLIILLANSLKNIPRTIISRCQPIKFSLVNQKEIADFLTENYKLNKEEIEEISALSFNRPGRAIKFAENKNQLKNYLESQKKLIKILEHDDLNERLKTANDILARKEIKEVILNWKILARDLYLLKTENEKLVVNFSFMKKLREIVAKLSLEKIYKIEEGLNTLNFYLERNINPKLALDNFVINL